LAKRWPPIIELDLVLLPIIFAKFEDYIDNLSATIDKAPLAIKLEVSKKEENHIYTLLSEASILILEIEIRFW